MGESYLEPSKASSATNKRRWHLSRRQLERRPLSRAWIGAHKVAAILHGFLIYHLVDAQGTRGCLAWLSCRIRQQAPVYFI